MVAVGCAAATGGPTSPSSPAATTSFLLRRRLRRRRRGSWRGSRRGSLCCRGSTLAPAPARRRRCRRWCLLRSGRRGGPEHARADLSFRAHRPVRGVHVHAPDHDRRPSRPHRCPFLGQGPPGIDRVPRPDWPWKLPVRPLPRGHVRDRHVHRSEPHRDRHHQGGRGVARPGRSVGRQRREIAGYGREKRYLGIGDGAAAGRPLTAQGEVVERDQVQFARV